MEKIITSVQNSLVKRVTSLHHAKYRAEFGEFIAEGARIVQTILDSRIQLINLFLTDPKQICQLAATIPNDKIIIVAENVMEKISTASTPSGILAVFKIPPQPSFEQFGEGIVLADVADPGNMGTLIRTAAAMDRKTIVIVGGTDPWSPKVVQASAGTIGAVNLYQLDWHKVLKQKKERGLHLIALVIAGGKTAQQLSFEKSLLVVGSEARGIPDQWISTCDELMTLEMPGNIESLNAAVAGSIALYLSYEHRDLA